MEKYRRSKTADDLQQIPLNLPPDHIYCQSTGKVQSYIGSALSKLQKFGRLVIVGRGGAIQKAITVAELVKRKSHQPLHQHNRLGAVGSQDIWEPIDSQLDSITVQRMLPAVEIQLSAEPFGAELMTDPGYQPPKS